MLCFRPIRIGNTALHRSILPMSCMGRREVQPAKFPLVQHDKLWPTIIFVRRPSCLELTARTFSTNHINRTFQALSKTFLFGQIARSAYQRHPMLNGLYKFTHLLTLLTYLLTYNNLITCQAGREHLRRLTTNFEADITQAPVTTCHLHTEH